MRQVAGGESGLYILRDLEKVTEKHLSVSQYQVIKQNEIIRNNYRSRAGKSVTRKRLNEFAKVEFISGF